MTVLRLIVQNKQGIYEQPSQNLLKGVILRISDYM